MIVNDYLTAERVAVSKNCGYWELDGKYFFNKVECFRYASKNRKYDITYHFFDSAYKNLDWNNEPSESLTELYRQRAQQLRDKYDYLILSFSGGSDSTNILNAFIDNNIKLDEVYCEYAISKMQFDEKEFTYDRNSKKLISFEWFTAAKPVLDRLAQTNPNIKITVDDASEQSIRIIEDSSLYKFFRGGASVNPNTAKYYNLYEICMRREKYGRVGCITGLDKPRISYNPKNNLFFSSYNDFNNIFSEFPHDTFQGYQASLEYFYYSYDFPKLNQKQCFSIKNKLLELMQNVSLDSPLYVELLSFINPRGIHVYDVHHDFFKKILYEKWNTKIWQAKKDPNFFYPSVSQWFNEESITTVRTRDFYDKQLIELLCDIDSCLIQYEDGKPHSLKSFMTKPIQF